MRLTTERLYLIPVSETHVEDIYTHFNARVTQYMVPVPAKNIDETKAVVRRFIEQREQGTDMVYAVTRKDTREFIGLAGLHHLEQDVPELGIWTKLAAHGRHYGREAIGGLLNYAVGLGIQKVVYPVDRRNIPSRKIPLFYGGRLISEGECIRTEDGRTLEIERYEIELHH